MNVNVACCCRCDSSGRGSAEKPTAAPCSADREIQLINSVGGSGVGGPRGGPAHPRGGAIVQPDSGIQPDHEDAGSVTLVTAPSVDSMHQFYDEGGGEAGLSAGDFPPDQPIIDADELVLNSCYGAADYLLNWRPEYQPLADVFAELARLPDETANRRPVAKTCPTHIVPQPPVNHRLGSATQGGGGSASRRPPPIITSAPPRAVRVAMAPADNDSVTSSASSNHVPSSLAWTYQPSSFRSRDSYDSAGHANRRGSQSSDREIQI